MSNKTVSKPKQYGRWTLIFLVVANMIGAGVFTTSGYAMGDLRSPNIVILAWLVGGLIAIAGAISYGQLIRKFPESGGEYLFLSRAWHPMIGFIAGWVSMFAGFSGAIAFAATAFESYALEGNGNSVDVRSAIGLPVDLVAVAVVVVAALLHGIKVKLGAAVQNVAVILKLGLLVAFIVIAFCQFPSLVVDAKSNVDMEPVKNIIPVFCKSLMFISLSYLGFNAAVYVADEVGEAKKIIPGSLVVGTVIVVVLYVLLNAIFVYSGNANDVAGSGSLVAAYSAKQLGGTAFELFFRVIISVALLTSVTSMMMAAPRVYAKMAEEGMLPSVFKFQNATPIYSVILQVFLATIIICWSTLESLLGYLGITLSLCAAASVSSLFLPKYRDSKSLFSVSLIAPAIYIGATILAIVMTAIYRSPWQLLAALATFAIGAVGYLIMQKSRPNRRF